MNICNEGQPFGANYNESYAASGLKGHTGQDWSCGFGTPIHAPFAGLVYKVLTKEHPSSDGSGFTGVFMIVDDGVELFEFLIGHCDPTVMPGTQVKAGDVVGTEANHGEVFSGNIQITLAMQAAGDKRGAHRHYQKRPVQQVGRLIGTALSIEGGGMYRDEQGDYYQVFNYGNGYNGCVDPTKPTFARDLTYGSQGYDVYVLQRILIKQGFLAADCDTAYFGELTAHALAAYQAAHNINPTLGYFGPITRAQMAPLLLPPPDLSWE